MTSVGYIERICKERAEGASSDHLEGEAHSHVVAATFGDQAFVSVVEEEEPPQFQTCRRPRVAAVPKRHSLGSGKASGVTRITLDRGTWTMLPRAQKPRIRCDLTGHPSVGGLTPVFAALFPTWAWAVGHAGLA